MHGEMFTYAEAAPNASASALRIDVICRDSRQSCSATISQSRLELRLGLNGRYSRGTIWIADAHRDDGKRFVVRSG